MSSRYDQWLAAQMYGESDWEPIPKFWKWFFKKATMWRMVGSDGYVWREFK